MNSHHFKHYSKVIFISLGLKCFKEKKECTVKPVEIVGLSSSVISAFGKCILSCRRQSDDLFYLCELL